MDNKMTAEKVRERDIARMEAEMIHAETEYFRHRPQLFRTIEKDRIFEAGFKAAWNVSQALSAPRVPANTWEASGTEYDKSIHTNPDHYAWADFFLETFPNCGADRDTMAGWFANAMMAKVDSMRAHLTDPGYVRVPAEQIWRDVDGIERRIACNEIAPAAAFTLMKQLISQALSAPRVPAGWIIRRGNDGAIVVQKHGVGGYAAREMGGSGIAESILYHLADAMLAASPEPVAPDAQQVIADLRAEVEALKAKLEELESFRAAIVGWREWDWPEWFSRATAEHLAYHGKSQQMTTAARLREGGA